MTDEPEEIQDDEGAQSDSEYVYGEAHVVIFPDGASALAEALGALALRVVMKTGEIEMMDAQSHAWRQPKVRGDSKVVPIK